MKRFMKGCGIVALVLIVSGVVLGMAGRTVAGSATIEQVVEAVTGGRFQMDGWGIQLERPKRPVKPEATYVEQIAQSDVMLDEGFYDISEAAMFDTAYDILKGNVAKYCPGSGIRNLDIEVGGGSFSTGYSGDGSIYLEAEGTRKFQGYVKGDTLYIKSVISSSAWSSQSLGVILYLPENYGFDRVEIEIGAGTMAFVGLTAKEASLEVGAGSIELNGVKVQELEANVGAGQILLSEMEVGKLDVEVGMGEFTAVGAVNGDADVECAMGSVDIALKGSHKDFNYHLEGAMGNIWLEGEGYISGGFAQERKIDNGAGKSMEIECSLGNISIGFLDGASTYEY